MPAVAARGVASYLGTYYAIFFVGLANACARAMRLLLADRFIDLLASN